MIRSSKLLISDRIYGECFVSEDVLIDLIASEPMQRLKGINQAGAAQYGVPNKTISRYEHSIGVMLLLRNLGATLLEQISGLLHDIPHTAFSHSIDFVFRSDKHDFHDKFFEKILMSSEIPNILKSHNYDVGSIVNLSDFLLLEREAPDLCADRLDYTLRDSATYHGNVSIIKNILSHIKTHDNIIVVDNADVAKELSLLYLELNRCYWANPKELVLSEILADAIKLSYEQGFISFEDFFGDDKYLFEKIKENKNKKVSDLMRSLESPFSIQYVTESDDYDYCCKGKLRTIDPIALTNSGPRRVSEIFPTFKDTLQNHNRHFLAGQYIKVVK